MFRRRFAIASMLLLAGLASCADPYIESTTDLESSSDTTGPYQVRTIVVGTYASDDVELLYNPFDKEPENYIPIAMTPLDEDTRAGELFEASMPGQPAGTTVRYYIRVLRDDETVAESPVGGDIRPFRFDITP